MADIPRTVCPSCKTPNDLSAVTCKKCGEILGKKSKTAGKKSAGEGEYDPTEGAFSPACIIVPAVLIFLAIVVLFLSFGSSAKPGTCRYNREKIGLAVMSYNRSHPNDKMTTLDINKLLQPGKNGKPYLKERYTCPKDPRAVYLFDAEGKVVCSVCGKN